MSNDKFWESLGPGRLGTCTSSDGCLGPCKHPGHDLDPTDVDEVDDIDDGAQLKLVWCRKHKKYEWHWIATDHD